LNAENNDAANCTRPNMKLNFAMPNHWPPTLQLLVARTPVQGGGEADLQNAVRYCPFCGQPTAGLFQPKAS
jgi:hypothetical protein